jgi:hypothetical protein
MTQAKALKISGPRLMRGVKTSEARLGSKTLILFLSRTKGIYVSYRSYEKVSPLCVSLDPVFIEEEPS